MKAEVVQQRSLLELAELDAGLSRIDHRAKNLPAQQQLEEAQSAHGEANDRLAAVQIALEDLDGQVAKFESEIDAVRQREDRDRSLLAAGTVDAKQLTELQHELETLERRQSSLEDSLLEVMERREELQSQQAGELAEIDELRLGPQDRALRAHVAGGDAVREAACRVGGRRDGEQQDGQGQWGQAMHAHGTRHPMEGCGPGDRLPC